VIITKTFLRAALKWWSGFIQQGEDGCFTTLDSAPQLATSFLHASRVQYTDLVWA
jgi:hypothetical protein